MDYKHLYYKYKNKYIILKSQIGGKIFWRYREFTEKDFVELYEKDINHNDIHYSLEFLLTQISSIPINSPFNILVGCTNLEPNDYYRFKDSEFYSLFIDSIMSNNLYQMAFDSRKQYHMYTILYEDLITKLQNIPQNIASNIYFDTGVSYFCPANEYFQIVSHILIPGGNFVFNYGMQHANYVYYYDSNTNKFSNNKFSNNKTKEELEDEYKIKINIESRQIIINKDIYVNNKLDPQYNIIIRKNIDHKFTIEFKKKIEYKYIDYLIETYPQFTFREEICNYKNYNYRVPIRIFEDNNMIETFDEKINFILNEMNIEEKLNYVKTGEISREIIIKISIRILENKLEEFCKLLNISDETLKDTKSTKDKKIKAITTYTNLTLMKEFKYIVATKN